MSPHHRHRRRRRRDPARAHLDPAKDYQRTGRRPGPRNEGAGRSGYAPRSRDSYRAATVRAERAVRGQAVRRARARWQVVTRGAGGLHIRSCAVIEISPASAGCASAVIPNRAFSPSRSPPSGTPADRNCAGSPRGSSAPWQLRIDHSHSTCSRLLGGAATQLTGGFAVLSARVAARAGRRTCVETPRDGRVNNPCSRLRIAAAELWPPHQPGRAFASRSRCAATAREHGARARSGPSLLGAMIR